MLNDFSVAWADFIKEDGSIAPPIWTTVGSVSFSADPDGIVASWSMYSPSGDLCMVSVLFPMPTTEALYKCKRQQFPIKPGDMVKLVRKIDEVVGMSGERYSRFLCEMGVAA